MFLVHRYGAIANPDPFEGTLEEAQKWADENLVYLTKDVVITDEKENEICRRKWHLVGMKPFETPTGCIRLCDGYFEPWQYA